jgi:hypothetical protein
LAKIAQKSSTRAYAGHSASFRHIFDIQKLNLTEYARSFGLYKSVHEQMKTEAKQALHKRPAKKNLDEKEVLAKKEADVEVKEQGVLFTRRL